MTIGGDLRVYWFLGVSFCVAFVRVRYALIFLPNVFFGLLGDDRSNVGDFEKICVFFYWNSP
jgi:hypothetical protein